MKRYDKAIAFCNNNIKKASEFLDEPYHKVYRYAKKRGLIQTSKSYTQEIRNLYKQGIKSQMIANILDISLATVHRSLKGITSNDKKQDPKKTIENLRDYYHNTIITYKRLSSKTGIPASTLNNWVLGKSLPREDYCKRINAFLKKKS